MSVDSLRDGAAGAGEKLSTTAGERPEVPVAAAFGGGLLLALILKKLAG